jgi:hypothetical protein
MKSVLVVDLQRAQHLGVAFPIAVKALAECYSQSFICVPETPGLALGSLPDSYRISISHSSGFDLSLEIRKRFPHCAIDICVPVLPNDFRVIEAKLYEALSEGTINNVSFYHDYYAGSVADAAHLVYLSHLAEQHGVRLTHYQYWERPPVEDSANSLSALKEVNKDFTLSIVSPDLLPVSMSLLETLVDPTYYFPVTDSIREDGVILIAGRPWCTTSQRYGNVYNFGGPNYTRSLATITTKLLEVAFDLMPSKKPNIVYCADFRVKQDIDYTNLLQTVSEALDVDIIDTSTLNLQHLSMDMWVPRLMREAPVSLIAYDSTTSASFAMAGCRFASIAGCPSSLLLTLGATQITHDYITKAINKGLSLIDSTAYGRQARISKDDGLAIHSLL